MKESYGEGLANHISLESCGDCSDAMAEALTEGSTGGLLSSENTNFRVPTTWSEWEGNTNCSAICELRGDPAESENLACVDILYAGIGGDLGKDSARRRSSHDRGDRKG